MLWGPRLDLVMLEFTAYGLLQSHHILLPTGYPFLYPRLCIWQTRLKCSNKGQQVKTILKGQPCVGLALFTAAGGPDSWACRDLESEPASGRGEGGRTGPCAGAARVCSSIGRATPGRKGSREQVASQWSSGHRRGPWASAACSDPREGHTERRCWERTSMHTWTRLTNGWGFCLGILSFNGGTFGTGREKN